MHFMINAIEPYSILPMLSDSGEIGIDTGDDLLGKIRASRKIFVDPSCFLILQDALSKPLIKPNLGLGELQEPTWIEFSVPDHLVMRLPDIGVAGKHFGVLLDPSGDAGRIFSFLSPARGRAMLLPVTMGWSKSSGCGHFNEIDVGGIPDVARMFTAHAVLAAQVALSVIRQMRYRALEIADGPSFAAENQKRARKGRPGIISCSIAKPAQVNLSIQPPEQIGWMAIYNAMTGRSEIRPIEAMDPDFQDLEDAISTELLATFRIVLEDQDLAEEAALAWSICVNETDDDYDFAPARLSRLIGTRAFGIVNDADGGISIDSLGMENPTSDKTRKKAEEWLASVRKFSSREADAPAA